MTLKVVKKNQSVTIFYKSTFFFSAEVVTTSWPCYSSAILWILNTLVLGICLVKIFVYGDPIIPSKSKLFTSFWRHRKQADFDLSRVNENFWFFSKARLPRV